MKDIELPPLPRRSLCEFDGAVEIDLYTKEQMQSYARAAVEAYRAQRVPDDFLSHKSAWRAALVIAQGFSANEDDSAYWSHEIKAFDRAYARLLASTPAPAQQEPVFCTYPACQSTGKTCLGACAKHAAQHQEPPQQERKPMTDREIADATSEWAHVRSDYTIGIIRAAERHHGIKE